MFFFDWFIIRKWTFLSVVKMKLFKFFIFCLIFTGTRQENEDCFNFGRLIHEKPGDVTITGIFDGYAGENCSNALEIGVEEMTAAVWTVTALERNNYIPGMKIGLSLFDSCSTSKMAQEAFAEAILHASCQNSSNIGMITTPEIDAKLATLSQKLNKTVTRIEHLLDLDGLLNIVVELLTNLHWTTVNRVIADSHKILTSFSQKMSDEGICVYDEVLATDKYSVNNKILIPVDVPYEEIISKDSAVIVVICRSDQISNIFVDMTDEMRTLPAKWLLVPTDFSLNLPPDVLPDRVFCILPLVERKEKLLKFLNDGELQKDHMNHRESTRSPLFVKIAVGILELLRPLKQIQEKNCSGAITCPEMKTYVKDLQTLSAPRLLKITPDRIISAINELKIDANEKEPFLFIALLIREKDKTEDAAIFQVFDMKSKKIKPVPLIMNERLFNERPSRSKRTKIFKINVDDLEKIRKKDNRYEEVDTEYSNDFSPYKKHPCVDILSREVNNLTSFCGTCQNFIRFYVRYVGTTTNSYVDMEEVTHVLWSWRYRTWVAINASVASIGIMCTVTVIIFIIVRICKGDILEGSPHFSFLILICIIVLYISTLPFSLDETDNSTLICRLRIIAPSLSYPILFSVILSRSLMVIFSERDGGIMSHVNGCLQTVLCFFMSNVQIALTLQFWIYNLIGDIDCKIIHSGYKFIILLIYSFFLLTLLAFTAPFTMRSKRNYREGTFFSISTFVVIAVWCVWLSFYYLLPPEERDAAVALGLTATATAVLLSVFIPRTYLMATATVRDKITNTLPSLAYINASNVSEINYRSNQALYGSDFMKWNSPKLGFSNSRIYNLHMSSSAPASPNNCAMSGTDYMLNRRKTFIEVAGGVSPENSIDSHESPDATGKITRF